jgi:hypothetical protein
MTPERNDADQRLDALLRAVRSRFLAGADAGFDFEAGLADVCSRAARPVAGVPGRAPNGGPAPRSAVAEACDHLGQFVVALGAIHAAGPLPDPAVSQLRRAAEVVLRLHDHVAAGSLSAPDLAAALTDIRDALARAGLIMRTELGRSLDDLLISAGALVPGHDDLGLDAESWLRRLEHRTTAALAAGDPARARKGREARARGDAADRANRRRGDGSRP